MKDLYYFSNSDVMVQVHVAQDGGIVWYKSHRKIDQHEQEIIEAYLESEQEVEVDYAGINSDLVANLNQFHAEKRQQVEQTQNSPEVDEAIQQLITGSMESYYFEQIGDLLVKIRNQHAATPRQVGDLVMLVEAYNGYAANKVDAQTLLQGGLA